VTDGRSEKLSAALLQVRGGSPMAATDLDQETFETLARLLRIMTYMFEDGDQPEDKEVLQDIAAVRAWMAKLEK
jgi:hypothetical protein